VRVTVDRTPPSGAIASVEVGLALEGPLDEGQRARLEEIVARCPVHRALGAGVAVTTTRR
jgi:uncharacterized OsmC-like protein